MSCRVLKRDMEIAMLDALVEKAREIGITCLRGYYLPTNKNAMVRDHYNKLGFECVSENPDGSVVYSLNLSGYLPRNTHIRILEPVHGQ